MKSTVNNLDITPLLRFLLWRNSPVFSPYFFCFLPPSVLPLFSNARFHRSSYPLSTFSNSFLIYLNIPPQTFDHSTHTTTLLYTSPVIPFFCTLPPPPLVILLLLLPVQTLQSTFLRFSSFLSSPKYCLLL